MPAVTFFFGGAIMGLKSIFREGMKERKRRKSLGKVNREFKDKEKVHAGLLIALGQKAWEAKVNISAFSDLHAPLAEAQKNLDDLRAQTEQLQKQKQDSEAKKKQENDRLSASEKEVEEKKRALDMRLNEQKSSQLAGQKETQQATSRLVAIASERGQLQNKNANPAAAETEKLEITKGLDLLAKEEGELKTGIGAREEAGKPVAPLIAALMEESAQLQKQLEGLRNEQRKMLVEMDKKIAAAANDLSRNKEKTKEAENIQRLEFKRLGERLAAARAADPSIASEINAAQAARTEMEGIQAMIGGLDRQKDESQVSAYKKMMAIVIGGIFLLAALIALLVFLLAPKKRDTPFSSFNGQSAKRVTVGGRSAA
jgi:chromosome segregation ATPase